MAYREIRVRPVVRYIVTEFSCDDDYQNRKSIEFGEFDNVERANVVAFALAEADATANGSPECIVEPARKLRIEWLRGPGEPKEAICWQLIDETAAPSIQKNRPYGNTGWTVLFDQQIKYMVDRFLAWRLPENFAPDAGISFKPTFNDHMPFGPQKNEPVGTNLFDAQQAEAMVRYMLEGMPQ